MLFSNPTPYKDAIFREFRSGDAILYMTLYWMISAAKPDCRAIALHNIVLSMQHGYATVLFVSELLPAEEVYMLMNFLVSQRIAPS